MNASKLTLVALAFVLSCDWDLDCEECFFEPFDTLDEKTWQIQLNSWENNGCEMTSEALSAQNGILNIKLQPLVQPTDEGKQYACGGMGTVQFFGYGTFTVRLKAQVEPGTVGSIFLINEFQEGDWEQQEIDIEFLGKDSTIVQFTVHRYTDNRQTHTFHAYIHELGFDASADYHEYGIAWLPDKIQWLVDGQDVHTERQLVPDAKKDPLQIRANHWMVDAPWAKDWVGCIEKAEFPSQIQYDWIRYTPL